MSRAVEILQEMLTLRDPTAALRFRGWRLGFVRRPEARQVEGDRCAGAWSGSKSDPPAVSLEDGIRKCQAQTMAEWIMGGAVAWLEDMFQVLLLDSSAEVGDLDDVVPSRRSRRIESLR